MQLCPRIPSSQDFGSFIGLDRSESLLMGLQGSLIRENGISRAIGEMGVFGTPETLPSKNTTTPPKRRNFMGPVWGFRAERISNMLVAHKIGAAISGPRITGRNLMDMGLFVVHQVKQDGSLLSQRLGRDTTSGYPLTLPQYLMREVVILAWSMHVSMRLPKILRSDLEIFRGKQLASTDLDDAH